MLCPPKDETSLIGQLASKLTCSESASLRLAASCMEACTDAAEAAAGVLATPPRSREWQRAALNPPHLVTKTRLEALAQLLTQGAAKRLQGQDSTGCVWDPFAARKRRRIGRY